MTTWHPGWSIGRVGRSALHTPPRALGRPAKLALTGTAAGAFSGLFGVGGGIVLLPLMILWLGYREREATGTSLAAVAIIAGVAALTQGAYGNVQLVSGLAVGLPAVVGVVVSARVQQRIPTPVISWLLSGLLVVSAVELVAR